MYYAGLVDNRGSPEAPFGFVSLRRGARAGSDAGRIGFGSRREDRDMLAVWPVVSTPDDFGPEDLARVRALLAAQFPALVGKKAAPGSLFGGRAAEEAV